MAATWFENKDEVRKTFFGGFGKPIMVFGAFAVTSLGQPDLVPLL